MQTEAIQKRPLQRFGAALEQHPVIFVIALAFAVTLVIEIESGRQYHDKKGGITTAKQAYERYPSIQKFCADSGYRGAFVSDVKQQLGLDVDISEKIKPHQWEKLP